MPGYIAGQAPYGNIPSRFNTAIVSKPLPGTNNTDPSNGGAGTGSTLAITYGGKLEAEGDFDAVRLIWISHVANATNSCIAAVATTETASTVTQASLAHPMAGGTAYNAVRSGTDTYGWNTVTWAGASSVSIAGSATVATPTTAVSDWIPLSSIPRADGGTRPLLMWRAYHDGSANAHSFTSNTLYANARTPTAANRGRVYQMSRAFADGVTTLGTTMALSTDTFPIAVQFRYRRRGLSVAAIGDSLTSTDVQGSDVISTWAARACYDISTPDMPIVPCNLGYSAMSGATFLSAAKTLLPTILPDVCFYSAFSPNDIGTPTQRSVWDGMGRTADFLDFCVSNRIVPIITTPLPMDSYSAATDAFRAYVSTEVKKMARSRGIIVADFESAVANLQNSPAKWKAAYYNDGTHPNEAGVELMGAVAGQALQQAIALYK